MVASTDPGGLPGHSTWYLLTNLPRPATRHAQQAELTEVVRLYGLRNWVEQGYKQVKGELGWADFQVRSDRAIRRHWTLVCWCVQLLLAGLASPSIPTGQHQPTPRPFRRPRGGRRRPVIQAGNRPQVCRGR